MSFFQKEIMKIFEKDLKIRAFSILEEISEGIISLQKIHASDILCH